MIDPGSDFYVVTIGRRYVRYAEVCIVCRQVEHAERYDSAREAHKAARALRRMLKDEKKPIAVQRVRIDAA